MFQFLSGKYTVSVHRHHTELNINIQLYHVSISEWKIYHVDRLLKEMDIHQVSINTSSSWEVEHGQIWPISVSGSTSQGRDYENEIISSFSQRFVFFGSWTLANIPYFSKRIDFLRSWTLANINRISIPHHLPWALNTGKCKLHFNTRIIFLGSWTLANIPCFIQRIVFLGKLWQT